MQHTNLDVADTLPEGMSLTVDPKTFYVGGPLPSGISSVLVTELTGIFVGDPPTDTSWIPCEFSPYDPIHIIPVPHEIFPIPAKVFSTHVDVHPPCCVPYTVQADVQLSQWRVQFYTDRVVASCDIPGAVLDSIDVVGVNGSLQVKYRRFDDNVEHCLSLQYIGTDYDPTTAKATVAQGVLTVTVQRFAAKVAHKIPVTQQ